MSPDRQMLTNLLLRWQRGEVAPWEVIDEAEAVEEGLSEELHSPPRTDPNSIAVAVLELLATAPHQRILLEDIPAILRFLETPAGAELEAWEQYDRYWSAIDFDAREGAVAILYSQQPAG